MFREAIKENMEYLNLSQKDLVIKTGLSTQHVSEILSGKREPSSKSLIKFEKALGLPKLLLVKLKLRTEEIKERESDSQIKDIAQFLVKQEKYKLYADVSLTDVAANILGTNTLEEKKKEFNKTVEGFRKFKDKSLAYLWVALMENKYGSLKSVGKFKKSSGNTIIKNVLDILINSGSIDGRIAKVQKYLDENGIILKNAPFLPNSSIQGVSFHRNRQKFIFMTDMNKREYSYIFTLIHELMHHYKSLKHGNKNEDEETAKEIKTYLEKYNKRHPELELAMETFENKKKSHDTKWSELRKLTEKRVDFGDVSKII